MIIAGFKAWTADGQVHVAARFDQLPDDELQIINTYYAEEAAPGIPYRHTIDGCDWYFWNEETNLVDGVRSESFDGDDKPKPRPDAKRGTGVDEFTFARLSAEAWEHRTL